MHKKELREDAAQITALFLDGELSLTEIGQTMELTYHRVETVAFRGLLHALLEDKITMRDLRLCFDKRQMQCENIDWDILTRCAKDNLAAHHKGILDGVTTVF